MKRRKGSGTLIFLAFMVLAFLFVISLFQWFGNFLTKANKIFNQGNCARLLAESAINEAALQFALQVNNFPNPPASEWADFFSDADSVDPVVSLSLPGANNWSDISNPFEVTFNCSVTDDMAADSVMLYFSIFWS